MICLEGRHLGVGIPTEIMARLCDAGPNTARLRDLYFQIVLHIVAENVATFAVRPDEVQALAAPSPHGLADADVLADLGILTRDDDGLIVLDHVHAYTRPSPLDRMTRTDAIMGWAVGRPQPFHAEDVADFLGITVQTAANYLGKLARDGLLDRVSRGYYRHPVDNTGDSHGESPDYSHECVVQREITQCVNPPRARATIGLTLFESKTLKTNQTTTTNPKATTNYHYEKQLPKKNLTTTTGPLNEFSQPHKSRRATRIPDPFIVDASMREWARTRVPNLDIDSETEDFVDYWTAKSEHATKLDWVRTWQMWMRRATRYSHSALLPKRTGTEMEWRNPECPPGMDIYGAEYAALKREAKAAWRRSRGAVR